MTKSLFTPRLRLMSHVHRWDCCYTINRQSNADHSFYVAHYAWATCMTIGWYDHAPGAMAYGLWHDVDETFTGDILGPAKRRYMTVDKDTLKFDMAATYPSMGWSTEAKLAVKVADWIDSMAFCCEEMNMGNNRHGAAMYVRQQEGYDDAVAALKRHGQLDDEVIAQLGEEVDVMLNRISQQGFAHDE